MQRCKVIKTLLYVIIFHFCTSVYAAALPQWQAAKISPTQAKTLFITLSSLLDRYKSGDRTVIGLSAINLKTGQRFSINGDSRFFMASTYKVAIAVQLFTLVEEGKLSLDEMVNVSPEDLSPGSGLIVTELPYAGIALSVKNLLALMLQHSDNTATDILLKLAGGPKVVTARLRQLGIQHMRVDRSTLQFMSNFLGVPLPPKHEPNLLYFAKKMKTISSDDMKKGVVKFLNDPRDTTTPDAMVKLLSLIQMGKALKPAATQVLLTIMSKKDSEVGRLYFYLPEDTWIAEKLGTGSGVVNDVGIIKLPADRGGVLVLAIYTKFVPSDAFIRDKVPARVARVLFDFFAFVPTSRGLHPQGTYRGI